MNISIMPIFPWPSSISPYAEAVQKHTIEWAYSYNLIKNDNEIHTLQKAKFGFLVSRSFPKASCDQICLAGDYFTWLFSLDDLCDRASDNCGIDIEEVLFLLQNIKNIVTARNVIYSASDTPYEKSLKDILRNVYDMGSSYPLLIFQRELVSYIEEIAWEINMQTGGFIPSYSEYLEMRTKCGFAITNSLIPIFDNPNLPDELYQNEVVRKIELHLNLSGCMANDLHSFYREQSLANCGFNLVFILQKELGVTTQKAVIEVQKRHDENIEFLKEHCLLLPVSHNTEINEALKKYVENMFTALSGYYEWAKLDTRRYVEDF